MKNRPLTSELLANTGNDFKRAGPHGKGWIISALFITFLESRGGESWNRGMLSSERADSRLLGVV